MQKVHNIDVARENFRIARLLANPRQTVPDRFKIKVFKNRQEGLGDLVRRYNRN